jgi:hypothetical protein
MANMTSLRDNHQEEGAPSDGLATSKGGTPSLGSRRRLLSGVAGGVGVLVAVQAKTALGQMACQSPSATISGNTSPRPGQPVSCSGGRSPGFWKQPQKFGHWNHWVPPTFNPNIAIVDCTFGVKNLSMKDIQTPGTLVGEVLPGAAVPTGTSPSIWAILAFPTEYGTNGQLMRHLIAASLNAWSPYFAGYALKPEQIADIWTQLNGPLGSYCPTSITCAPGIRWSANDVIAYISGMYDINASIENELCKKDQ